MKSREFRNRVCQFNFIDMDVFIKCGGHEVDWPNFREKPLAYWIRANTDFQTRLWAHLEMESRQ